MKEYILKDNLYNALSEKVVEVDRKNNILIFPDQDTFKWEELVLPTITKVDICREFLNRVFMKYSKICDEETFEEFFLTELADCISETIEEMESDE